MEKTPKFKLSAKSVIAAALMGGGAALMILYMGILGFQFSGLVRGSLSDSLGAFAGVGLELLHGLQSATLEHTVLFSFAYKFLVLFSAFGALATGIAMIRGISAGTHTANEDSRVQSGGGR